MKRMYADFLGFPFHQVDLIDGALRTPENLPDRIHVTAAPPFMSKMSEIREGLDQTKRACLLRCPRGTDLVFGLQSPPEDYTPEFLHEIRSLGVRFCTVAYYGQNVFGGGFAAPGIGLSGAGFFLVEHLADARITVDLSHANHSTARDVLRRFSGRDQKVCVTHSACYEVYRHSRNLPDDVLWGVADKGGVIGLPCLTWMLSKDDDSIEPFFAHLNHLLNLVGYEHVGIGSDLCYRLQTEDEITKNFRRMSEMLDDGGWFRPRLPEAAPDLARPDRFERLAKLMESRRYPGVVIDSVLCGNVSRYFK